MRFAVILVALFGLLLIACDEEIGEDLREDAVRERIDVLERAVALYPNPQLQNFPLREALIRFSEREDLIDHPWFVYILADTGNVIGYYVAQQVPVNSCTFLSSTEIVREDEHGGNVVLTAPSLDGIFYGGAGAAAGCDEWFFFDAATDAMIKIRGVKFFIADQPLLLDAEPIRVVPQ